MELKGYFSFITCKINNYIPFSITEMSGHKKHCVVQNYGLVLRHHKM